MSKTIVTVIRDTRDCMEPVYRDGALSDLAKILVSLVRLSGTKGMCERLTNEGDLTPTTRFLAAVSQTACVVSCKRPICDNPRCCEVL